MVTLDPNDPAVVWVGAVRATRSERGLWRWDLPVGRWREGLQNLGLKKSEHIGRVVVDPRDSKVVYVAAEGRCGAGGDRGLYKTTDAGRTGRRC